jgi:SEC-C motif-containing protein
MNNSTDFAEIKEIKDLDQKLLRSKKAFRKGDILSSFSKSIRVREVTYLTVQLFENDNVSLIPEYLQYINHSCDPNSFFDVDSMNLIALKDIKTGEELTFFYPSTEWEMVQPFDCFCKSGNCLERIEGASKIKIDTLNKYQLSSFIARKAGFCPCGSNDLFSNCCQPKIEGKQKANTSEELMRSRYSAYAISAIEYLIETTYKTIRKDQSYKEIEQWSKENRWQKLEVLKSTENTVEFKAYFLDDSKKQQIHHEKSTFIFENGSWFYSKGEFK